MKNELSNDPLRDDKIKSGSGQNSMNPSGENSRPHPGVSSGDKSNNDFMDIISQKYSKKDHSSSLDTQKHRKKMLQKKISRKQEFQMAYNDKSLPDAQSSSQVSEGLEEIKLRMNLSSIMPRESSLLNKYEIKKVLQNEKYCQRFLVQHKENGI